MDALLDLLFSLWLIVCLSGAGVALHDVWTTRSNRQ